MMMLVFRDPSPSDEAQKAPSGLSAGQMNLPVVELYTTCALAVAAAAAKRRVVYIILKIVDLVI
jgi:hypothetical protein